MNTADTLVTHYTKITNSRPYLLKLFETKHYRIPHFKAVYNNIRCNGSSTMASKSQKIDSDFLLAATKSRRQLFVDFDFDASVDVT